MSLNKQIVRLAVPSILANITIPLVGLVDTAIVGHISNAAAIGGIAIGTMLFDLLYWNFGFLRVGTSGMTAQAYGRESRVESLESRVECSESRGVAGVSSVRSIDWSNSTCWRISSSINDAMSGLFTQWVCKKRAKSGKVMVVSKPWLARMK